MSDRPPIDDALINDARALLSTFVSGDASSLRTILRPGVELVINRIAEPAAGSVTIKAPHLGTLVSIATVGSPFHAGDAIAQLAVLAEVRPVLAPFDGVVEASEASIGELIEFGGALVTISQN